MTVGPDTHPSSKQKTLSNDQIGAFYHDEFVQDQVRDFVQLVGPILGPQDVVVDVGGGCGFFAGHVKEDVGCSVRVIDSDPKSVVACRTAGVEASEGDALAPVIGGHDTIATFNLILHHLVAETETETLGLQVRALTAWKARARAIFVNEYIYESFLGNLSGALIFWVTKSPVLSVIVRWGARFVPALRANTLGVGVRFRSHDEWTRTFRSAGYEVVGRAIGAEEDVSPLWRLLLIKAIRRDSFLLRPLGVE